MNEEQSYQLYHVTRALSNPIRIQLLFSLLDNGKQNVSTLVSQVNITQPAVSHHLRILSDAALVKFHVDGKEKFFTLADTHIQQLLETLRSHTVE